MKPLTAGRYILRGIILWCATAAVSPSSALGQTSTPWNDHFISDDKMQDKDAMTLDQIRALLKSFNSFLQNPLVIPDQNNGNPIDFALEVYNAAQKWNINPQVLLITVQKEVFILQLNTPPASPKWQKHITNCGTDPSTFTIRGQLDCAGATYHNAMVALASGKTTLGGWCSKEQNIACQPRLIDGQYGTPAIPVTPATNAVAALFSFNPEVGNYWNSANPYAGTAGVWNWWTNKIFKNWVYALKWAHCDACPEVPEVQVLNGDTIQMGVANRLASDSQSMAIHGVSAVLPAISGLSVQYDTDLSTWDSYSSNGPGGCVNTGYWDSFSVTLMATQYWNVALLDPINANAENGWFVWGGLCYGVYTVKQTSGKFVTAHLQGDSQNLNYLNIALDTATQPDADNAYPSWGTIIIRSVTSDDPPDTEKGVGP